MIKHIITTKNGDEEVSLRPMTAIRRFCEQCMGFVIPEIEKCSAPKCSLYPFRMGNAHSGRKPSPESIEALRRYKSDGIEAEIEGESLS